MDGNKVKEKDERFGKLLAEWDESDFGDGLEAQDSWFSLTHFMNEVIKKRNPRGYWYVAGYNMGWRSLNSGKYMIAVTFPGVTSILPRNSSFKIYDHTTNRKAFVVQVFHHDSPVGNEFYVFLPAGVREYKRNVGEIR